MKTLYGYKVKFPKSYVCVGGRIEKLISKYILEKDDHIQSNKEEIEKTKLDEFNATFPITMADKFDYTRLLFSFNETRFKGYVFGIRKGFSKEPMDVYGTLEGIVKESNYVITPVKNKDILYCENVLREKYNVGIISKIATPAFKKNFLLPLDELLLRIDEKRAEDNIDRIDLYLNMRKCARIRLFLREKFQPEKNDKNGLQLELSDDELHYLSETAEMKKTSMVLCQLAILANVDVKKKKYISNSLEGTIESIFSGFENRFRVKSVSPIRLRNILSNNRISSFSNACSAYLAKSLIGNLFKPKPFIPMINRVISEPINNRVELANPILIGWTNQDREVRISPEHLKAHRTIVGKTGCGKSEYVMAEVEQIMEKLPEMRTVIFDDSGEYSLYFSRFENVIIYELNSELAPCRINLFVDDYIDNDEFVNAMSTFFTEALIAQEDVYSAQMKRVIREGLLQIVKLPYEDRNFNEYRKLIDEYCLRNPTLNKGDMTRNALQNRMAVFEYDLGKVFYVDKANWNPEEIENKHIIFNLKGIRGEAKNIIVNLILFRIRNYLKSLGKQGLRFLHYIEEAQESSPARHFQRTGVRTSIEKSVNESRKWGIHITQIGTHLDSMSGVAKEVGVIFNFSDKLSKDINAIMGYSRDSAEVDELSEYQMHVKLPENKRFLLVDRIIRPRRKEATLEQYNQFLSESEVYSEKRRTGESLDSFRSVDEIVVTTNLHANEIFEKCLDSKCPHKFYSLDDCLPMKNTGLVVKSIKQCTADVLHKYGSFEELLRKIERDYVLVLDEIKASIYSHISPEAKIMSAKLKANDKDNLVYCVFANLLKIMLKESILKVEEAENYLRLAKGDSDGNETPKYFNENIWED